MIRAEVKQLISWIDRLPESDDGWDDKLLDEFSDDIDAVSPPITAEEREALLPMMYTSEEVTGYGVWWGVLHLFESGPDDGFVGTLPDGEGTWLYPVSRYTRNFPRQDT